MTDEKKPPQGAVVGGQRKKLTKSERWNLERLDVRKIAPALVLDDRQRLAWGLLCEGTDMLHFCANAPHREAERLKGKNRIQAQIYCLRSRVEAVTELINRLEEVLQG